MTVYVAEIHGRAVVAFNADNDLEAEREIEDEIFQNDKRARGPTTTGSNPKSAIPPASR